MDYRRMQLITVGDVTNIAGPVSIALPSAGFYRIVRVSQRRTSGVAAANFSCQLFDSTPTSPEGLAFQGATTAANNAFHFPASGASPADPGRYLDAKSAAVEWVPGGDVAGDTWQVSIMLERVR